MTAPDTKTCTACGKPLKGRIDKRFCDDYCRNNYNNQQKSKGSHSTYVRGIMNTLLKNRKILEEILAESGKPTSYPKDKLTDKGFSFKYHTDSLTTKDGEVYFFCFEYGYKKSDSNWSLIVKRKEE